MVPIHLELHYVTCFVLPVRRLITIMISGNHFLYILFFKMK